MDYNLKNHADELSKIAISMSQIVHADVEIADSHLFRIIGTGRMKKRSNQYMGDRGHSCLQVLKTGIPEIILNPREAPICQTCKRKSLCKESLEIIFPIIINSEVVGTIGFVAYTIKQKSRIEKNLKDYLNFLENVSNYLSLKISNDKKDYDQLLFIKILETIFDEINLGIIVLNRKGIISKTNSNVKKLFNILDGDSLYDANEQITLENKGKNEILLDSKKGTFLVYGKIYKTDFEEYNTVLFFSESRLIQKKISNNSKKEIILGINRIIGKSQSIIDLKEKIKDLGYSKINVFIKAEKGLDIDEIAHSIYEESSYYSKKIFEIDFSALTREEMEKKLFKKPSILSKALGNTLVMKNIEFLPIEYQNKLSKLINNITSSYLTSNKKIRIISSSSENLFELVNNKNFSLELYYLLTTFTIEIPPLRNRKDDIPKMAKKYIEKNLNKIYNKKISLSEEFIYYITNYTWVGNISEFTNVMENVALHIPSNGIITENLLPDYLKKSIKTNKYFSKNEEEERIFIMNALANSPNDIDTKKKLAEEMGISIATLYRKIKTYELSKKKLKTL